jgi:hypothetical protein
MEYLPFIIIIAATAMILFQIKKKGFKGAIFGGQILDSSKEIKLSENSPMRGHIKVHTLENKGRKSIGLEVVQKSALSYDMTAMNFDREDALSLVSALTLALENTDPVDGGQ